jgi:hypothetical protein
MKVELNSKNRRLGAFKEIEARINNLYTYVRQS